MKSLKKGDYVLATKYSDGSTKDQWFVGFYDRTTGHDNPRHEVTDEYGCLARGNGFRRCEKISMEVGDFLLSNKDNFDNSTRSIWSIVADFSNIRKGVEL